MARKRDCYQTLGVTSDATPEEVRKAFRREAQKHHPDRTRAMRSRRAKFKEVNEAYQSLGRQAARRSTTSSAGRACRAAAQRATGSPACRTCSTRCRTSSRRRSTARSGPGCRPTVAAERRGATPSAARIYASNRTCRSASRSSDARRWLRSGRPSCARSARAAARAAGRSRRSAATCSGTGQTAQTRGFVLFSRTVPAVPWQRAARRSPCPACLGQRAVETERQVEVHFPPGVAHGHHVRVHGYGLPGETVGCRAISSSW